MIHKQHLTMKKLHLILLLYTSFGFAQLPVTSTTSLSNPDNDQNFRKDGNYAQDTANERQQYVGIWEYNQNGILFQVKIEKKDQFLNKAENNGVVLFYNFMDVVVFKYKLVKNGVTIYDNLNQTVYSPSDFVPTAIKKGIDNYLYGYFMDYTRNLAAIVKVTKTNSNPDIIKLEVFTNDTFRMNPESFYNGGQPLLTIPTGEIEMVRIN
jgi:hypothetical protein